MLRGFEQKWRGEKWQASVLQQVKEVNDSSSPSDKLMGLKLVERVV